MKDHTLLIIGCIDGSLYKYSLATPSTPSLVSTIKLPYGVYSLLSLSDDRLLCGQKEGYLNMVDVDDFDRTIQFKM